MVTSTLTNSLYSKFGKKLLSYHRYLGFQSRRVTMQIDLDYLSAMCKQLPPPLSDDRHKGQAGRIGVFGGSLEYTGAPYFAAISALRVGADLVHVFCSKEAGPVIKSYSPELIVHPLLDVNDAVTKIQPWLERLHVILIGPGLGRDSSTFSVISEVMNLCRNSAKPLVIDADGLFFVTKYPESIRNYPAPGLILTPNAMEYARLAGSDNLESKTEVPLDLSKLQLGPSVTILRKGLEDIIMSNAKTVRVVGGGSGRRCGGQGDLLAGSLSIFYAWALQTNVKDESDRPLVACYAACKLTRKCNEKAFAKKGRSMVCSDMIDEIGEAFREEFEEKFNS